MIAYDALATLKEVVAILAEADRDLANAKALQRLAKARGVLTSTHDEMVRAASDNRDHALECFLLSWGAWLAGAESTVRSCPSCGRPGEGFCGDCQAAVARLPQGDA